jgi:hypothetical protein
MLSANLSSVSQTMVRYVLLTNSVHDKDINRPVSRPKRGQDNYRNQVHPLKKWGIVDVVLPTASPGQYGF